MVWENVGYLVDDARRAELFAEFKKRIGLKAHEIANAPMAIVSDIAKRGGMVPQKRAERLREIGKLAIAECDGDIVAALARFADGQGAHAAQEVSIHRRSRRGPDHTVRGDSAAAERGIKRPGAHAGAAGRLREERKSYSAAPIKPPSPLLGEGAPDTDWLKRAYHILREHGKTLCKRSAPICEPCPLDRLCAHRPVTTIMHVRSRKQATFLAEQSDISNFVGLAEAFLQAAQYAAVELIAIAGLARHLRGRGIQRDFVFHEKSPGR